MKTYSIGRDLGCDIVINDTTDVVSRRHAVLTVASSGKMTLTDLSSNQRHQNDTQRGRARVAQGQHLLRPRRHLGLEHDSQTQRLAHLAHHRAVRRGRRHHRRNAVYPAWTTLSPRQRSRDRHPRHACRQHCHHGQHRRRHFGQSQGRYRQTPAQEERQGQEAGTTRVSAGRTTCRYSETRATAPDWSVKQNN